MSCCPDPVLLRNTHVLQSCVLRVTDVYSVFFTALFYCGQSRSGLYISTNVGLPTKYLQILLLVKNEFRLRSILIIIAFGANKRNSPPSVSPTLKKLESRCLTSRTEKKNQQQIRAVCMLTTAPEHHTESE